MSRHLSKKQDYFPWGWGCFFLLSNSPNSWLASSLAWKDTEESMSSTLSSNHLALRGDFSSKRRAFQLIRQYIKATDVLMLKELCESLLSFQSATHSLRHLVRLEMNRFCWSEERSETALKRAAAGRGGVRAWRQRGCGNAQGNLRMFIVKSVPYLCSFKLRLYIYTQGLWHRHY